MVLTPRPSEKLACASRSLTRFAGFGMTGFHAGWITDRPRRPAPPATFFHPGKTFF